MCSTRPTNRPFQHILLWSHREMDVLQSSWRHHQWKRWIDSAPCFHKDRRKDQPVIMNTTMSGYRCCCLSFKGGTQHFLGHPPHPLWVSRTCSSLSSRGFSSCCPLLWFPPFFQLSMCWSLQIKNIWNSRNQIKHWFIRWFLLRYFEYSPK